MIGLVVGQLVVALVSVVVLVEVLVWLSIEVALSVVCRRGVLVGRRTVWLRRFGVVG